MTDAIDMGCQCEQEDRDRALAAQAAKPSMPPLGFCYNCDAVGFEGCFCDADCRDDYELREKQKRV